MPAKRKSVRGKRKKGNPFVGETIQEFIVEERERDPVFAAEFDRLALARAVRALRESKHMSQGELAERAHTKQPAIARLESGRTIPRLDLLQKVAAAMGVRLEVRLG